MNFFENNRANVCGEIIEPLSFSHKVLNEKFYKSKLKIDRFSGVPDYVPIMVSGKKVNADVDCMGRFLNIKGQFRSHNVSKDGRRKCELYVFAKDIEEVNADEITMFNQTNTIYLNGFLRKEPTYRETPLGKQIADLIVAVNRSYGKTDYIPCICWGEMALWASNMMKGTNVEIKGRIQSRDYTKVIDGSAQPRVAYEVAVKELK